MMDGTVSELVEPQLVQLDSREKQSYTEQAAKRKHCQRLTRYIATSKSIEFSSVIDFFPSSFIRLCDYLVVSMLHDLAVKSTSHVLTVLKAQTGKEVEIIELAQEIPDDIEKQEEILQVLI